MISFIHCGSEKRVYRFPKSNKLADARRRWLAMWVHSNSLIKRLTPFADDAEIRLLYFLMYSNSQKKLSSRWLHSKLISTAL